MTDQITDQNWDSILFASKASQLINERKIEDALEICEAGVREFPFYSPGHYTLGLCYQALGKEEDAKDEFERTLVYDPSHNKAMRKLSEFYRKTGLDQLANELLIKEALYSPLDPEIIQILKENNLYKMLNPDNGETAEIVNQTLAEAEEEKEVTVSEDNIESIEEIEETTSDYQKISEHEKISKEDDSITEEESGPIDNLDPLAGEDIDDKDDLVIDNAQEAYSDSDFVNTNEINEDDDDFSPLMEGYLEKDDQDDDDQWMEVEDLLEGEKDMSEQDVDPVPERPKNETEKLLEELSSNEDDDINLEAAVVDPYDHIDLTSDVDKSSLETDDLDNDDLAAAVKDPLEKDDIPAEKKEIEEETEEEGETISEIVSEFEKDEDSFSGQIDDIVDQDESIAISEEPQIDIIDENEQKGSVREIDDIDSSATEQSIHKEDTEQDQDDEVTINDMLENPNLVTPTFGEILIAQHKFSEARHVFVELSKKEPDNTRFMKKIQFLDKFLQAEL